MSKKNYHKLGFTLIELLIVIGIVAILAVAAFVALNPGKRLEDSRDAKRWSDVTAIVDGIKVHQVDSGGAYGDSTETTNSLLDVAASDTNNRMIITVAGGIGVDCLARTAGAACDVAVTSDNCADLSYLVTSGYVGSLPRSPTASKGNTSPVNWSAEGNETGYYLRKNTNGTVTVGSCDSENVATSLSVQR